MELVLHDNRRVERPTEEEIRSLFSTLRDPGDFLRLQDPEVGEIRAAGPAGDGTFLLQCDLPRDGAPFRGELEDISRESAVDMFLQFSGGQTGWCRRFRPLEGPQVRRWLPAAGILLALLVSALVLCARG